MSGNIDGTIEIKISANIADNKQQEIKEDPKPQAAKNDTVYSVRGLSPEAIAFVKDYAYTKRKRDKTALEEMIMAFKKQYESDKNNEPLLKCK